MSKQLLVLGGGIMGCGIAAGFQVHGWDVQVMTPSAKTRDTLPERVALARAQLDAPEVPIGALRIHAALNQVDWPDVDLVIEAVTEDLALKQALLKEVDAFASIHTVIASNTSTLPIADLAQGLAHPERVVGAHYFMPAHIVPLVEVVGWQGSNPDCVQRVIRWFEEIGKKPIWVKKDIPGFVANRIQHALMREALYLIDTGVASPEDVDVAVRYGFGFRFVACGPILQKEMSGWDTNAAAGSAVYPHLNNSTEFSPLILEQLKQGRRGMKDLKGLWDWTEGSVAETRAQIDKRLQAGLRILKDL
jgi:3-hydroxybutyryl-CoA dehydrogenase